MERNPQFQTVKDAGADEVADAQVDKITVTENKNNSAQVTDIEQNKVDFMVDPPATDRLQEVKTRYGDRFRLEESINTYYFWMNTQQAPFNDLAGASGGQLRRRPRGPEPDLRRPPAPDAAGPAARHAWPPGIQAVSGAGPQQGETAYRRSQPGGPRTSPYGPTTSPTASGSASTTTTCCDSSASTRPSR